MTLFDIQPPIPPGSSQSYGWRHHHNQFPTLHKNSKKAIKIPRGLHSARANRTIAHPFMKPDEEMIGERKSEINNIADRKFQNKTSKISKDPSFVPPFPVPSRDFLLAPGSRSFRLISENGRAQNRTSTFYTNPETRCPLGPFSVRCVQDTPRRSQSNHKHRHGT